MRPTSVLRPCCAGVLLILAAGCQTQLRHELQRLNGLGRMVHPDEATDPFGCSILSPWEVRDFHLKAAMASAVPAAPVYRIKDFTLLRPESGKNSYLCLLNGDPNPAGIGIVQVNFNEGSAGVAYVQEGFAHLIYPPDALWPIERMIVCPDRELYLLWDPVARKAGLGFAPDKFEIMLPMDNNAAPQGGVPPR